MKEVRAGFPLASLAVVVTVVALVFSSFGKDVEHAVVGSLVLMVMVIGTYVFIGNSGVLTFGHIAFAAIGAYVSSLLTIPTTTKAIVLPDMPHWLAAAHTSMFLATLIAMAVTAVLALLISIPVLRLVGIAASIATFAVLIIVENVAAQWKAVTGGLGTLTGVPFDTGLSTALLWALAALLIAFLYQRTAAGLRLRSSREDEVAARSIGVRVERERRVAFVLSAVLVAAGGSLYAHYLGAFGPKNFFIELTFITLVMLIVGGKNSLAGAVLGTFFISLLNEVLGRWESGQSLAGIGINLPGGATEILVAALFVAVVVRRPEGFMQGREIRWPSFGRAGDSPPPPNRAGVASGGAAIGDRPADG